MKSIPIKKLFSGAVLIALLAIPQMVAAYSGGVDMYLTASETTVEPGDSITVLIQFTTDDLVTENNERIQTISSFVNFPTDAFEVNGLNFTGSAFNSDYVRDFDNGAGTIEIVRARSNNDPLSGNVLIGTIEMDIKPTAPAGEATIQLANGLNNVLLNDINNSDVVQNANGVTITIGGSNQTPPPDDDDDDQPPPPTPTAAAIDAALWLTSGESSIAVGDTTEIQVRLDTGSVGNNVTSTELAIDFPVDLLQIVDNNITTTGGVFGNQLQNTVDNASGTISAVFLSNQPVTTNNGLVASFMVERIAAGEATISIGNSAQVIVNDANNTNILLSTSPVILNGGNPPSAVQASVLPSAITESQSVVVRFQSGSTGNFSIRRDSCTNNTILLTGNYPTADAENEVTLQGNIIGVGNNQAIVVCIEPSNAPRISSSIMSITVSTNQSSGSGSGSSSGSSGSGSSGSSGSSNSGSGSSNSSGSGSSSGSRSSNGGGTRRSAAPTKPNEDDSLDRCEAASNLSVENKTGGDMRFSWNSPSDSKVNKLQLAWGTEPGNKLGAIDIPVVNAINFPTQKINSNTKYYFWVVSMGDCAPGLSSSISAIRRGDFSVQSVGEGANDVAGTNQQAGNSQSQSGSVSSSQQQRPAPVSRMQSSEEPPRDDLAQKIKRTTGSGPLMMMLLVGFSMLFGSMLMQYRSKQM